jgi:phosphoribosylformylglycinamidine synthase subunit PurS
MTFFQGIEIASHPDRSFPQSSPRRCRVMKAKIHITPKKAVLDPQGKAVQNALAHLGHTNITAVHVGKYLELELSPDAEPKAALESLHDACRRFLTNPVIEDYQLVLE